MMTTIPNGWPAAHRPALLALLHGATDPRRFLIMTVVRKYVAWSREAGDEPVLDVGRLRRFHALLYASLSGKVPGAQMRILYDIGVRGPDADVRDWLYENFDDVRKPGEIVRGSWWPTACRAMASRLVGTLDRRFLQELDNFFRFRQRAGGLSPDAPLEGLFLREGLAERTTYARLQRLCWALEHVEPGSRDLELLRGALRELHAWAHPGPGRRPKPARRVQRVEALLASAQRSASRPWRPDTIANRRKALNLYFDVLRAAGRPFTFDRPALDLFADHMFDKVAAKDANAKEGWRRSTASSYIAEIAPFIPDPVLRREWRCFTALLRRRFRKRGDLKVKASKFAERPWGLEDFYRHAQALREQAEDEGVQERWKTLVVVGMLGILLFFPLRRADLRRLTLGREIVRTPVGWELRLPHAQKRQTPIDWLRLPEEASPFLDVSLLQGASPARLWAIYEERTGQPFFPSRLTGTYYNPGCLGTAFTDRVGHSPHILRSVWHDDLVEQGADRLVIQHMLQHRSIQSQAEYDIVAGKIRLRTALRVVIDLADRVAAA